MEYRPGFTECADCGAALVDELPPKPRKSPRAAPTDVVVAREHSEAMVQLWAELLGRNGIACRISQATPVVDMVYPVNPVYEVLVANQDANRARSVLPADKNADRIRRSPSRPTDDDILNEVDQAIAHGDLSLAEELLDSIEERSFTDPRE
jgi:hypothetical protein